MKKPFFVNGVVYWLEPNLCNICRRELQENDTGRPRKYCSDACKMKAYRIRRRALVQLLREHGQEWYVTRRWVDYRSPFPA